MRILLLSSAVNGPSLRHVACLAAADILDRRGFAHVRSPLLTQTRRRTRVAAETR